MSDSIRITKSYVTDMAKHAEQFTDGAFRLGHIAGDIGHGTRFVDGVQQLVWFKSREAAAYYMGAMLGWARESGTEIPSDVVEFCRPMRELTDTNEKLRKVKMDGEQAGKFRAESKQMR